MAVFSLCIVIIGRSLTCITTVGLFLATAIQLQIFNLYYHLFLFDLYLSWPLLVISWHALLSLGVHWLILQIWTVFRPSLTSLAKIEVSCSLIFTTTFDCCSIGIITIDRLLTFATFGCSLFFITTVSQSLPLTIGGYSSICAFAFDLSLTYSITVGRTLINTQIVHCSPIFTTVSRSLSLIINVGRY